MNYRSEEALIRLPPGIDGPPTGRRIRVELPAELYIEDKEFIIRWLEALYLEPRPVQPVNPDAVKE
jgi:hypothetical protein